MTITVLVTIYATMAFCYCVREWSDKYYPQDLWLLDILLAPYFIINEAIYVYKKSRKSIYSSESKKKIDDYI